MTANDKTNDPIASYARTQVCPLNFNTESHSQNQEDHPKISALPQIFNRELHVHGHLARQKQHSVHVTGFWSAFSSYQDDDQHCLTGRITYDQTNIKGHFTTLLRLYPVCGVMQLSDDITPEQNVQEGITNKSRSPLLSRLSIGSTSPVKYQQFSPIPRSSCC